MLLQAKLLSRSFGNKLAVKRASFDIDRGEILALIGASGSGKTTTLRMLNRLIEPDSGELLLGGQSSDGLSAPEWRRRIGYVVQGGGLFPHMTIARNISVTPRLLKWDQDRISETTHRLLDMVGLPADEYASRLPAQLSGGQQQRVNLARALAGAPELILMDEPFGALDAVTKDQLLHDFKALQKKLGFAVVLVTHDLSEAIRLADRIAIMEAGEIMQIAAPRDLIAHPVSASARDMLDAARNHAGEVEALFRQVERGE